MGSVRGEDGDLIQSANYMQSSVANLLALPFGRASIAVLYASGSVLPSLGNSSKDTSKPLYASEMFFWRCSPIECERYALLMFEKQQLTNGREFAARYTNHGKVTHLAAFPQVKEGQAYNTNLLVRFRSATAYETSRVLSGTDLYNLSAPPQRKVSSSKSHACLRATSTLL